LECAFAMATAMPVPTAAFPFTNVVTIRLFRHFLDYEE
jgi:hypothetical protein